MKHFAERIMSAGAQPENFQHRRVCGTGALWQIFCQKQQKKGQTGKHFGVFMNGKFNPKMDTIRAFLSKIRTLLLNFRTSQERFPIFLVVGCLVIVAEYASMSLNMPKYPWKCLNKLFWRCKGSEYTWLSDMFDWLLRMPQVLNKPGFWIRHGCKCKGYTEFQICLTMAPYASIMPQCASVWLNLPQYAWTWLNIVEFLWICLKIPE